EALISAGRVSVDGATVQHQGMRVDPQHAVIHVDGLRIQLDDSNLTLALHKPAGVYSTMADEQGRPDLSGYVAAHSQRLFHVGRLDAETTGLILLTNDGELAHRLTHPSYVVPKTYIAQVEGRVTGALRRRLLQGVELQDGPVVVDALTIKESAQPAPSWSSTCTKAATTSCVACSPRWAIRCSDSAAPGSGRSAWARSNPDGPARSAVRNSAR